MGRRTDKKELKEHKTAYKEAKAEYKGIKKNSDETTQKELKESLKVKKRDYKQSKKNFEKKHITLKKTAKFAIKSKVKNSIKKQISKDENLAELNQLKQRATQRTQIYRSLKGTGKTTIKIGTKTSKSVYKLSNKTYNLVRGRGFHHLPTRYHSHYRKLQRAKFRLKQHRLSKGFGGSRRLAGKGISVLNNPFKVRNIGIILSIIFPFIIVMSFFVPSMIKPSIVQNDRNLTEAYLELTKLDAKHTNSVDTFYTNWNDALFYLNFRYDNFNPKDEVIKDYYHKEEQPKSFEKISTDLWETINGKEAHTVTPLDKFIRESSSPWFLKSKDFNAFDKARKEIGFSALSFRLGKLYDTDSYLITRRMGYEHKRDSVALNEETEIKVDTGTSILAPLTGTLEEVGINGIVINQDNRARLTISGIDTSRLNKGDILKKGDYIGNTISEHITLVYELNDGRWYKVNPAFYLNKVAYAQNTIIASSDFSPESNKLKRAKQIYDYFIKKGYSVEGISAMLGNFDVESQINPKSAEGEIGNAVATSWDKDEWLSKTGPEIYNGRYPNILKRGLGLGQWTDTSDGSIRHTMLREYAKSKGKKWYDMELQLEFMTIGDTPSSINILESVLNKKLGDTVSELTVAFLTKWEGNPGDKVEERIQSAQNWFNYFSRQSTIPLNTNSAEIYDKYKDKMLKPYTNKEVRPGEGWEGNAYALGNCTWYVYNRMKQFGKSIYPYMGNANEWSSTYYLTEGATLVDNPQAGDIVIFNTGVYGSHPAYGHVAICEAVLEDGSFIISEMNFYGEYSMSYRIIKPAYGLYFMHVN
jgi:prgK protein